MRPLTLDTWDDSPTHVRSRLCARVAHVAAAKVTFERLETFRCGSKEHEIGVVAFEGRELVLVPGSPTTWLGCDSTTLKLGASDYESLVAGGEYESLEAAHESFEHLVSALPSRTSKRRAANVPTMLVEREPRSMSRRDAERLTPFRLPTEDEWEYLCSGGEDAFFRWGNAFPVGFMPPFDGADPTQIFEPAREPNAFGLTIAHDLYDLEWCATPHVLKGGDGGTSLCDQVSSLELWSTLATSFRCVQEARPGRINPFTGKADPGPHLDKLIADARRVLEIDVEMFVGGYRD